jgi:hypothetical protein
MQKCGGLTRAAAEIIDEAVASNGGSKPAQELAIEWLVSQLARKSLSVFPCDGIVDSADVLAPDCPRSPSACSRPQSIVEVVAIAQLSQFRPC